jgi:hypothetical protein
MEVEMDWMGERESPEHQTTSESEHWDADFVQYYAWRVSSPGIGVKSKHIPDTA